MTGTPTGVTGLTYVETVELKDGTEERCYECPDCEFAICEWTQCPECGWYDGDAWERTVAEGWP